MGNGTSSSHDDASTLPTHPTTAGNPLLGPPTVPSTSTAGGTTNHPVVVNEDGAAMHRRSSIGFDDVQPFSECSSLQLGDDDDVVLEGSPTVAHSSSGLPSTHRSTSDLSPRTHRINTMMVVTANTRKESVVADVNRSGSFGDASRSRGSVTRKSSSSVVAGVVRFSGDDMDEAAMATAETTGNGHDGTVAAPFFQRRRSSTDYGAGGAISRGNSSASLFSSTGSWFKEAPQILTTEPSKVMNPLHRQQSVKSQQPTRRWSKEDKPTPQQQMLDTHAAVASHGFVNTSTETKRGVRRGKVRFGDIGDEDNNQDNHDNSVTPRHGGRGGGGALFADTASVTSKASSIFSFAMRGVVPFDFLNSNVLKRHPAGDTTRDGSDPIMPALILTHDDVVSGAPVLTTDVSGPVLILGDCGEDIVAVIMVLQMMETYCVQEHQRMLSTVFSHVVASGSGGFVALALSQGDTMQSLLELLMQHDSLFLRHRSCAPGEFITDNETLIDTVLKLKFAEDHVEGRDEASSGTRRASERLRRADFGITKPCVLVTEKGGEWIRCIDWSSKALIHRLYAVAANYEVCVDEETTSSGNSDGDGGGFFSFLRRASLGGDQRKGNKKVHSATKELPDPSLFALRLDPLPSLVCRIGLTRHGGATAADDAMVFEERGSLLSEEFGSNFVDITLPAFVTPPATPTAAFQQQQQQQQQHQRNSLPGAAAGGLPLGDDPIMMSGMSFGLETSLSPMESLLAHWNLDGKDKRRRVAVMSQTEAFIEENEGTLQRATDFIISRAAAARPAMDGTPPQLLLHSQSAKRLSQW